MVSTELVLQPLSPAVVACVAALHAQAIPYSLNSRLGLGHLAQLYAAMQADADCWVRVAMLDGEVAGAVSATLAPSRFMQTFLWRRGPRQWAALAWRLAARPVVLLNWGETRHLSQPLYFGGQKVEPCLSAIVVAEGCRRRGVGRALVGSVDGWVRAHHLPAYFLDTLAENQPARSFYRRLGFIEAEQRGEALMLVKVI